MNEKLIKVGRATLAVVMASSMVVSSLNVFAQEIPSEDVFVDEENQNEQLQEDVIDENTDVDQNEESDEEPIPSEEIEEEVKEEIQEEVKEEPKEETPDVHAADYPVEAVERNIALGKTVTTSSNETPAFTGVNLVDGSGSQSSRWSSEQGSGPQWAMIDLGEEYKIDGVNLYWESGKANGYSIKTSTDGVQWQDVYTNPSHPSNLTDKIQFEEISARYVKLDIHAVLNEDPLGITVAWPTISLYEIQVLSSETEEVDKTQLQSLYDEASKATFKHAEKELQYAVVHLNTALEAANTVLENKSATEEDVDKAFKDLELMYERCLTKDKAVDYIEYNGALYGNKWCGYFDEEYPKYTTESALELLRTANFAYDDADDNYYKDVDGLREWRNKIDEAVNNLKPHNNQTGQFYGFGLSWMDQIFPNGRGRGGTVTVNDEIVTVNGVQKVRLHMTLINNGIHMTSGENSGDFSDRELKSSNAKFELYSKDESGSIQQLTITPSMIVDPIEDNFGKNIFQPLNGDYENGIVATFDVDPGEYAIHFKIEGNKQSDLFVPGVYRTSVIEKAPIDYTNLDAQIKYAETFLPDEQKYTEKSWETFKNSYEAAINGREDASLTQENIDDLATNLLKSILGLRLDPTKPQELKLTVEKVVTDRNTVIVKIASNHLLTSPSATAIKYGETLEEKANPDQWVYDVIDGNYVYALEYTENGTYDVECTDIYGSKQIASFEIEDIIEPAIKANINGNEVSGESVQDMIEKLGVSESSVETIEFISGEITTDDLTYLATKTKNLEVLKVNLNEDLKLLDKNGNETTVLPSVFKNTKLVEVELGGITEISSSAFRGSTKLNKVSMPNIVKIGKDAFYQTDDYENIELPSSIEVLDNCGFGVAKNGRKTLTVTIDKVTSPECVGSPFNSANAGSYVKVPKGSLKEYLPNLDLSKTFKETGDSLWANIEVKDEAYHYVKFYTKADNPLPYDIEFGYIQSGSPLNSITNTYLNISEGFELESWNTKKDGTGTRIEVDGIISEDMELYPIAKELDMTPPVIEGITDDMIVNTDVTYKVVEQNIDKIVVDGIEYDENSAPYTITSEGEHVITVTDTAGNATTVTFTIDKTTPVIDAKDITLTVGGVFDPMKDVIATDNLDGDLTEQIKVESNVDMSRPDKYEVTYSVADKAGNTTTLTIIVTVNPKMEELNAVPTINASDVTLTVGDKFDPLKDVSASDTEDGDITAAIKVIANDVDTSKAGEYHVTYEVTDSQGATTTKTITVTVNPKMEELNAVPTINATDKVLTVGDKFDPLKDVSASDTEDGDITASIKVIANDVDTSKAGEYHVTYEVTDSQGATTTKTITVTVKEKASVDQKPNEEKKPNKNKGTKTGVEVGARIFAGLALVSALGVGTLEALKRRKK